MLKTPIFITNFKNYESATGINSVFLSEIHQEVAEELNLSLAVAVSTADLYRVSSQVNIPVLAQHVDPIDYGSHTGHNLAQNLKSAGAVGSLINHSERRIDFDNIMHSAAMSQKTSLVRIVCAATPDEVEQIAALDPDFIAYEPPELIGSKNKSVASEKPESIARAVQNAKGIPLLVGAGINSPEDIKVSLDLGAQGFLVASAIVKAKDPKKALKKLLSAFS